MIPSEEEALALHRKHGSNGAVISHCLKVRDVARVIAEKLKEKGAPIDMASVEAGALLHDIGRSRTHDVVHGLVGSQILEQEGADPKVVQIVRRHVGAGLSVEDAEKLGLPKLDYVPRTIEERTVCFADKMVSGNAVVPFGVEVERFTKKGHDVERLIALRDALQKDLGTDPEKLVMDKIKESR